VRGLVFEAKNSLGALAETVGAACRRLTDANVPHNLFIVDRGARIFLLPNAFAERKV
jgi:GDP-L-galactose phosphorylase